MLLRSGNACIGYRVGDLPSLMIISKARRVLYPLIVGRTTNVEGERDGYLSHGMARVFGWRSQRRGLVSREWEGGLQM